jgi:hypothetical protein
MTPEQRSKIEEAMRARSSQEPQTMTYKKCVTQKELNEDPFSEHKASCTRTVITSTSRKMDIRQVCENEGVKAETIFHIEALSSENVKGSGHVTATKDGHTMNEDVDISAKWLGAICTGTK